MAEVRETISIGSKADTRGFKKAETAATKLNKTLKNLAITFGATYSTAKVIQFGKSSVKALTEAEKSSVRLANSVKNLGLSFSTAAIQKNLDEISRSAGIAGEVLVDAYQPLLTATGSIIQSQKMLKLALDVSAGSGVELVTVTQDLADAYVGNTRGLRKYDLGLTTAEIKTISYTKAAQKLNAQFSGSQAAYLDTYAAKLAIISEAATTSQERIGAAIIDLSMAFAGSSDMDDFVVKIEKLTDKVIGMFDKFTEGIAILKAVAAGGLTGMLNRIQDAQVAEFNRRMKRDYMKAWDKTNIPVSPQALAQQKAAEAAAKKRAEQIRKEQEKQTKELKKQAALKKAGTVFDREQIELVAALKGKLTSEETTRVQAQLALLNGNDAVAKQLTDQILKAQDASGNLAKFLAALPDAKNPFQYLDAYLSYLAGKAAAIAVGTPFGQAPPSAGAAAAPVPSIPATNVPAMPSDNMITYNTRTGLNYNPNANNVVVELKITGEGDVTNAIAKGLQNQSLSTGDSAYINRRTGGFAG
jgi:hypothetical protein